MTSQMTSFPFCTSCHRAMWFFTIG